MSSGVDAPDDLKHCPQSAREDPDLEDLSGTENSILYLLQEATKLATPSNQYSMAAEGLHSKEELVSTQKGSETQPSFTGAFSMLNDVHAPSSPWEVMSLINLQCERLLHCGPTLGEDRDFYTCTPSMTTDDLERTDIMECSSLASAGPAEIHSCEVRSTVVSGESSAERDAKSDVCSSVLHVIDESTNQLLSNQPADERNDGTKISDIEDLAELISKNTADIFSSVGVMSEERNAYCLVVETSLVPLGVAEANVDPCHQPPLQSPLHTQEGEASCATSISEAAQSPSPEISSVDFTSSLVDDKDGNSSMCFAFGACENPEPQNVPQTPQRDGALVSRTDLNNNLEDDEENEKLQEPEEDQATPSTPLSGGNRRRTPRKQAHPERSPDLQNPELQGVTFSMHTELDRSTDQCRLLITSNYSEVCRRGRRSRSSRSRSLQSSQRTSSSEEESDPASLSKKICASCCTRKTPLWRDAEDGTPLCNACGIRYKKYRVRCLQCWNIPKKEANSNSKCLKCGDLLQLAPQSKRAGW